MLQPRSPSGFLRSLVSSVQIAVVSFFAWYPNWFLWPPGTWSGRFDGDHLSGSRSRNLWNFIHATPLRCYYEQRFLVGAAEHAREAAAINIDCLQHLATFADTNAPLVRNVCIPDSVLSVEADTVGSTVA